MLKSRNLVWLVLLFLLACREETAVMNYQIVGYYPAWNVYSKGYEVQDIVSSGSAQKLTVINYAFGNVAPINGRSADSGIVCKLGDPWADYQRPYPDPARAVGGQTVEGQPLMGNFQQLKALKEAHPNIKVLISLGGWTWSKWFSDAALTAESRALLVESCIDLFIRGNLPNGGDGEPGGDGTGLGVFDGIDIDWEYPAASGHEHNIYRPEDSENFTLLLAEFRRQLDAVGEELGVERPFMLTVATVASPAKFELMELDKIHTYLDFINVMTYDFYGAWDTQTNFHANLFTPNADPADSISVDKTMQGYLAGGVPAEKLIMGVPFYGRGWTGVASEENDGLYQSAIGPAPASLEAGFEDYRQLAKADMPRFWQAEAKAPFLYDGNIFWAFDDPESICHKMAYVREHNLGGAMFWELAGDSADGALITAVETYLNTPDSCE